MAIAASTVAQLRSGIFFSAISRTCAFVTLPTKPRPGVLEPEAGFLPIFRPAAFFRKKVTGGVAHFEGERAVLIGGDDHRNRRALLDLRGARIEGLAEFHDVEAALTERGTDRRGRIGGPRRHLQFDVASYFLGH